MPSTRIGRRGQLTIPKAVRQRLKLSEGDQVAFVECGGEVVLRPVRHSLRDLRGSVPVDGPQDFDAVRAQTAAARAARETPEAEPRQSWDDYRQEHGIHPHSGAPPEASGDTTNQQRAARAVKQPRYKQTAEEAVAGADAASSARASERETPEASTDAH